MLGGNCAGNAVVEKGSAFWVQGSARLGTVISGVANRNFCTRLAAQAIADRNDRVVSIGRADEAGGSGLAQWNGDVLRQPTRRFLRPLSGSGMALRLAIGGCDDDL